MDIEKVKYAVESAEHLIETEIQIIEYDELRNEYIEVLKMIKEAKVELYKK